MGGIGTEENNSTSGAHLGHVFFLARCSDLSWFSLVPRGFPRLDPDVECEQDAGGSPCGARVTAEVEAGESTAGSDSGGTAVGVAVDAP